MQCMYEDKNDPYLLLQPLKVTYVIYLLFLSKPASLWSKHDKFVSPKKEIMMLDPFEAHIFHNALTDKQADWLIELMNKKGGVSRNELSLVIIFIKYCSSQTIYVQISWLRLKQPGYSTAQITPKMRRYSMNIKF